MPDAQFNSLSDWIERLLSLGRYAFSTDQLKMEFQNLSETAIKRSLDRLSKKNKIVSIYKGYYLIVPPQYMSKGMLPPALFIDGLMKYLKRTYYVGLLNAAAYHGAAHQQPQEYFVITSLPSMRPTIRQGVKVNYISKSHINDELIESRKVESGYLRISSPALTAIDLVQFEKRCGGLNRVTTVLSELVEVMKPEMFSIAFIKGATVYSIQRLGYLLDKPLNQRDLAEALFDKSQKVGLQFYRVPLKASSPDKGFSSDEKWKVVVNVEIETDL